jgi:hypothetical protein
VIYRCVGGALCTTVILFLISSRIWITTSVSERSRTRPRATCRHGFVTTDDYRLIAIRSCFCATSGAASSANAIVEGDKRRRPSFLTDSPILSATLLQPTSPDFQCQRHSLLNMFFLYNMERRVTLHPSYFGRNMHELVTSKLLKDVEGTCAGNYYIISIMDTFDISEGRILPGTGLAEFTVGYRAVVWRPFKGETVDAVVYSINPQGFFAQAGPLRLFVSAHVCLGKHG